VGDDVAFVASGGGVEGSAAGDQPWAGVVDDAVDRGGGNASTVNAVTIRLVQIHAAPPGQIGPTVILGHVDFA